MPLRNPAKEYGEARQNKVSKIPQRGLMWLAEDYVCAASGVAVSLMPSA